MHKFQLGQTVEYRSRNVPPGACVVTAKLPERNGEYEYHVRNLAEKNARMARENELSALGEAEAAAKPAANAHRKAAPVGGKGKR
jgi:hypothetical protein